jgi:hypothetical protein
MSVRFDATEYTVAPGETLSVEILFDADDQQPGFQGLLQGLLGMSFMVEFDPFLALVAGQDDIAIQAALDGDGLGGPALKAVGPGYAGAAGAVALDNAEGYKESLLAQVGIRHTAQGSYTLGLDFFFTDPRMADFVDIDGNALDDQITFGSASVTVVPEPASCGLLAAGAGLLALAHLIRRHRESLILPVPDVERERDGTVRGVG